MLTVELDFDLTDSKELKAFDDMQLEFYKLSPFWIKAYKYNEADSRLIFFVRDRQNKNQFIGGFTAEMNDNKAMLQFYPFDRAKFLGDLKKVCVAGVENNFAAYKGEKNEWWDNWRSTCNYYQSAYSVYMEQSDFPGGPLYTHSTMYTMLPSQFLLQLIGGKDIVKETLGRNFRVLEFEKKDEGDNTFSTKIKMVSKERNLAIWISEAHGMQSVRVLIQEQTAPEKN